MNAIHIASIAFTCGAVFGMGGSIIAMKIDEFRGRKVSE